MACTLCQFLTVMLSETKSETLRDETLTTPYSGTPLYSLDLAKRDVKFMSLAKQLVRFQVQQMLFFNPDKIFSDLKK